MRVALVLVVANNLPTLHMLKVSTFSFVSTVVIARHVISPRLSGDGNAPGVVFFNESGV